MLQAICRMSLHQVAEQVFLDFVSVTLVLAAKRKAVTLPILEKVKSWRRDDFAPSDCFGVLETKIGMMAFIWWMHIQSKPNFLLHIAWRCNLLSKSEFDLNVMQWLNIQNPAF